MHHIGIIGLGVMGQRMLSAMSSHREFEVTHVWDIDTALTSETASRRNSATAATDAGSLIRSPDLDLVYVATPPSTHLEYARHAAEANVAILAEKPLAVDLADARQLVEYVEQRGVANAVQFPFATAVSIKTLEEELQRGLHGESVRLDIRFHFNTWPRQWQSDAGSWLSGREQGGFLREVFSHFVYLTHRLVGEMQVEYSDVRYPDGGDTSEIYASARFRAGSVPTTLHGAVGGAAPDHNEWTLYGTERSYRLEDWSNLTVGTIEGWQDLPARGEPGQPLFHQLDELSSMLAGRPHLLPSFAAGLAVQEVVERILE